MEYKIVKKGFLEKLTTFEDRINDMARRGWTAKSLAVDMNGTTMVLLEKKKL